MMDISKGTNPFVETPHSIFQNVHIPTTLRAPYVFGAPHLVTPSVFKKSKL